MLSSFVREKRFFYQKSHEMLGGYQGDEEVSIVSQAGVEEEKNTEILRRDEA
jgi:hypothetical protein